MNRQPAPSALRLAAAALSVALAAAGHAATPAKVVRDLRTIPGPNLSSSPSNMVSLGPRALFWARTPLLGNELWQSDGTAAGTSLVADLCPGSCDSSTFGTPPIAVDGRAFFLATDGGRGTELWSSDGTPRGTRPLVDLEPGPLDGVYLFLLDGGDRALFATPSPAGEGIDLWSSDGTIAGTQPYAHIAGDGGGAAASALGPAPPMPLPGGRRLYFRRFEIGRLDSLWESDGTAAGTRLVRLFDGGAGESLCPEGAGDLPRVTDELWFAASTKTTGCELWRAADGVAAPFLDLVPGPEPSFPRSFVRRGAWTLFVVDRSFEGSNRTELYTTDGTPINTGPAAPNGPPPGTFPTYLGSTATAAYYAASTEQDGREIWMTEGPQGRFRIRADLALGVASSDPRRAGPARGRVFVWATHPVLGLSLYAIGDSAIVRVADVARAELLGGFAAAGERAVFGADLRRGVGSELGVTNGFRTSTGLLRDLAGREASANPTQPTLAAGRLLFTATDDRHGFEVFRTDGTAAGTDLVEDVSPPGAPLSGALLLAATSTGVALELPDGTIGHAPAASGGIDRLFRPAGEFPQASAGLSLGGRALFLVEAGDFPSATLALHAIDGRSVRDRRLAEIARFNPIVGYRTVAVSSPDGRRAFYLPVNTDGEVGDLIDGLWTTDGTVAGTRRAVAEPCAPCANAVATEGVIGPGDRFFYAIEGLGVDFSQLWVSDGTTQGTVRLLEAPGAFEGGPIRALARLGERLLFAAADADHGQELWISDGTPGGTRRVADLRPGPAPSWPDEITAVGARAYFSADDGATGRELWVTDGTAAGTHRVADLFPGPRSSSPTALAAIGGTLVFAADDGRRGQEVFASDGTAAGTRLVSDVEPGRLPSTPRRFVRLGDRLVFTAARGATGRELFSVPLAALGEP